MLSGFLPKLLVTLSSLVSFPWCRHRRRKWGWQWNSCHLREYTLTSPVFIQQTRTFNQTFRCAFTPWILELSLSHRVALVVSPSAAQLFMLTMLQEHMNHTVFIGCGDFQASEPHPAICTVMLYEHNIRGGLGSGPNWAPIHASMYSIIYVYVCVYTYISVGQVGLHVFKGGYGSYP